MIYEALAAVVLALVGALAIFTIWSRIETRVRALAVILFLAAIPVTGAVVMTALSNPAPCSILASGEFRVMSAAMVEGEAIYLWLDLGEGRPRYCERPWDAEEAERLQKLGREERHGDIIGFTMRLGQDEYEESVFHAIPQPDASEDKDNPPGYEIYERVN